MNRRGALNPMNRSLEREQTPVEKAIGALALFTLCVVGFTLLGMLAGF